MKKKAAVGGIFNAANDQYHGIRSIQDNGAMAHAYAFAKALVDNQKVCSEEEAVAMAHYETKRLQWHKEGFQGNRIARDTLRSKKTSAPRSADNLAMP